MATAAGIAAKAGPLVRRPGWLAVEARALADKGDRDGALNAARKAKAAAEELTSGKTQVDPKDIQVNRPRIDGAARAATRLLRELGAGN